MRDDFVAFGEIGLTGRLRPAAQSERRLEECAKLGLAVAVAPKDTRSRSSIRLAEVETLRDAVGAALDPAAGRKSPQIAEIALEKQHFPGISGRLAPACRRSSKTAGFFP